MVGHLADIITYAKFQDDIFRGYDFTGGRISDFPIDFSMGLTTVQRDCAACDYNSGSIQVHDVDELKQRLIDVLQKTGVFSSKTSSMAQLMDGTHDISLRVFLSIGDISSR